MEKWSIGLDAQEDELEKTVVVSTANGERVDNKNVVSQDEYGIEETVILSPDDFRKEKSPSVQADEDDMPATKGADQPEENDFISETVILHPDNGGDKR
jgi:hypothetical protein